MSAAGRSMGRPAIQAPAGARVSLGLRVSADLKNRIDTEAKKTGRTQSAQAELMLEKWLLVEKILDYAHV